MQIERGTRRILTILLLLMLGTLRLPGQTVARSAVRGAPAPARITRGSGAEEKTAAYFAGIAGDPLRLRAFLKEMPKGADLHSHLSGAVYAESFIRWGAEAGLCYDPTSMAATDRCEGGAIPIDSALVDPEIHARLVDAWSMRNWQLSGQSGHDHFFDSFDKFGRAGGGRTAEMLAEVVQRAASGNVVYLELMNTADGNVSGRMAARLGWNDDFAEMRNRLLAAGLRDSLRGAIARLDAVEQKAHTLMGCTGGTGSPACGVTVRWLYQVLRAFPREQVFAQILAGFELAGMDKRFVGLNLVQPEDWLASLDNYDLHMRIIGWLKTIYPNVHITLHAGELAPGMVPPSELCCHIRSAVEVAGAERIGHGVDVMYEDGANDLVAELARRNVMVEICLTSNDVILGVTGKHHPLREYLSRGVPVALATDDEGVSRIDITNEYLRAAYEQGVDYRTLKRMSRAGLEHAFVEGKSMWKDAGAFVPVAECAGDRPGSATLSGTCAAYLAANEKARLEWELESRFAAFEAKW